MNVFIKWESLLLTENALIIELFVAHIILFIYLLIYATYITSFGQISSCHRSRGLPAVCDEVKTKV